MREDERQRLGSCVLEPIRVPGAIQPHGALVTVDLTSFKVLQVSANAAAVLGEPASEVAGSGLGSLTGGDAVEQFDAILNRRGLAANPVVVHAGGQRFDAVVHEADGVGIIEFEPSLAGDQSAASIYAAIHRLSAASTVAELYTQVAREVHRLTEFDRVVVYHFHDDGHGEIVAEQLADGMEPYLGLHFPASDIPAQARQLYLSKLTRVIVLAEDPPAALQPADNPLTGQPLDLSHAELRSVSPHHVEFMRNMGQVTTMSMSLVYGGQLIGMITCSHQTSKRIPYLLREGYAVLARQVSMQLGALAEIERLTHLEAVRTVRDRLGDQLGTGEDIRAALLRGTITLVDLIPADGATLRLDGVSTPMGVAPDVVIAPGLLAELTGTHDVLLVSDELSVDYPDLHALMPEIAGILVVPFGHEGDYLAWFRKETIATVNWLGDQTLANRITPLSPRRSFDVWSESVAGKSTPWDRIALLEASEFRHDLNAVLLRMSESALARVALHDALTGLPNRRLLSDRMEHALTKRARDGMCALLFMDLDHFKQINDSEGHSVGDAVIVGVSERIRAVIRAEDTLARIGGDEFVVFCEDAGQDHATATAERILKAFDAPMEVEGSEFQLSVSIGIAIAEQGQEPEDLLRGADAAMYRAKEGGRGRASH